MKVSILVYSFVVVFLFTGCNMPRSTAQTPTEGTLQDQPTLHVAEASPTPLSGPKQANQPTPTSSIHSIKLFFVAVGDNGVSGKKIGCDDSLVPVDVEIVPTYAVLSSAFDQLLKSKDQFYKESGLYNALYQSDLSIDTINLNNGEAVIRLSGKVVLGGVCDIPRVEAQLVETARQFTTVENVTIYLNNQILKDALSQKD